MNNKELEQIGESVWNAYKDIASYLLKEYELKPGDSATEEKHSERPGAARPKGSGSKKTTKKPTNPQAPKQSRA